MEICPHDKRVSLEIRFDDDGKVSLARCCFLHAFSHLTLEEYGNIDDIIDFAENQKINYAKSSNICIAKCFLDKKIKQVDIGISHACNMKCYHCFFNEHKDTAETKKAYFDTLYKIKGHQLDTIMINNGGEVFVYYKEITEYLRTLTTNDTRQVTFITNLVLLDEDKIKELKAISEETGVNYFFLPSVDGITKESYEAIRIGGKFEKVTENLKLLGDIFGPENAVVLYTIKKPNIDETEKVEKYFKDNFGIRVDISFDVYDKDCEAKYTKLFRKNEKIEQSGSEEFAFSNGGINTETKQVKRDPLLTVITNKPLKKADIQKYSKLDFIEVYSFCGKKLKDGPNNIKYFKKVSNLYMIAAFKLSTKYILFLDDPSSLDVTADEILYYFLSKTNADYLYTKNSNISDNIINERISQIPILKAEIFRKVKDKYVEKADMLYNNIFININYLFEKYSFIEIPENVLTLSIKNKDIIKRIKKQNGILSSKK